MEVRDWDPAIVGALTLQTVKLQGKSHACGGLVT